LTETAGDPSTVCRHRANSGHYSGHCRLAYDRTRASPRRCRRRGLARPV